jgi:hypothetical protein
MDSLTGSVLAAVYGILLVPERDARNVAKFGKKHNASVMQADAIK